MATGREIYAADGTTVTGYRGLNNTAGTVYNNNANCFLITVKDSSTTTVIAGAFVIGTVYTVLTAGTTDFTLIGAIDSDVGTVFTATGVGIGTGTATYITPQPQNLTTEDDAAFEAVEMIVMEINPLAFFVTNTAAGTIMGIFDKSTSVEGLQSQIRNMGTAVGDTDTSSGIDVSSSTVTAATAISFT